ncbi:hypothetical protein T484DRAFT_1649442, partial [Baffinella frigidus]
TLHPTPYALHPAPYTLHPAPYTLHPTPCTLHPTPYTLHPTPPKTGLRKGGRPSSKTRYEGSPRQDSGWVVDYPEKNGCEGSGFRV